MTSAHLLADLRRDEGDVLRAYPDPLTHGDPWTIGVGHAQGVHEGDTITEAQSVTLLEADVQAVTDGLDRKLPWWRGLDDLRQDVLVGMAFNMGLTALLTFTTFLGLMKIGAFASASRDLLATKVARQLPARYRRLAAQIATGEHQP